MAGTNKLATNKWIKVSGKKTIPVKITPQKIKLKKYQQNKQKVV